MVLDSWGGESEFKQTAPTEFSEVSQGMRAPGKVPPAGAHVMSFVVTQINLFSISRDAPQKFPSYQVTR